jgi:hypothetical protein
MNMDIYLAQARVRTRVVGARAEAALARLGGEEVSRRSPSDLTDGLSAEEIERDAQSIQNILSVWKRIGKRGASTIRLPSGRTLVPKRSPDLPGQREYSVVRPPRRRGMQP